MAQMVAGLRHRIVPPHCTVKPWDFTGPGSRRNNIQNSAWSAESTTVRDH